MKKMHLTLALMGLTIFGAGSYLAPESALFWLTSADPTTSIMRIGLAIILLIQLVTEPPRHMLIRTLTGGAALLSACWGFHMLEFSTTPIFDGLLFIYTSLALAITALERPFDRVVSDKASAGI